VAKKSIRKYWRELGIVLAALIGQVAGPQSSSPVKGTEYQVDAAQTTQAAKKSDKIQKLSIEQRQNPLLKDARSVSGMPEVSVSIAGISLTFDPTNLAHLSLIHMALAVGIIAPLLKKIFDSDELTPCFYDSEIHQEAILVVQNTFGAKIEHLRGSLVLSRGSVLNDTTFLPETFDGPWIAWDDEHWYDVYLSLIREDILNFLHLFRTAVDEKLIEAVHHVLDLASSNHTNLHELVAALERFLTVAARCLNEEPSGPIENARSELYNFKRKMRIS
jgi:hypothetical protein